jgi:NAD(P)H-hydrate epimerase
VVALKPLPERPVRGHKGLFGRVLVVGGNEDMIGAPVLAGTAALRMGAGLVQVAMPRSVLAAALTVTPELIGVGLGKGSADKKFDAAVEAADAVVVGPGMGQSTAGKVRLRQLIGSDRKLVIDADGLNLLAAGKAWPRSFDAPAVLTPHPGEMKRLGRLLGVDAIPSDDDGRIDVATRAARVFGQVVVLKGDRTVVTDGTQVYLNPTGDSSLSKAGTGDVLSGILGTLVAQEMDRFDAACTACWIHGKAGEVAGERVGRRSALAREVVDHLPAAIAAYEKQFGISHP